MMSVSKWTESTGDETVVAVAERSLQVRLGAVGHFVSLAAQHADEDVEHVHQLRVWSRRATAALRLYRDLMPWLSSGRLKSSLSRIRRAANDARDYDVMLRRLEADKRHPGASLVRARVLKLRIGAQTPLVAIFRDLKEGTKYERLVAKVLGRLRERAESHPLRKCRFRSWGRKSLLPYVGQFFHDGQADLGNFADLHAFRISGKKLRYTMELLASAFPPRFVKRLYPRVEMLQDRLGEINDLVTAEVRYRSWLEDASDPSEIQYLRKRLAVDRRRLESRRRDFFAWWTPARAERLADMFAEILKVPADRWWPGTRKVSAADD